MSGPDAAGLWSVTLPLDDGEHLYKFVADGDRWFHDPQNPAGVPDGHGGQNSVLRLGRLVSMKESPARRGDGEIDGCGLAHAGTTKRLNCSRKIAAAAARARWAYPHRDRARECADAHHQKLR